MVAYQGMPAEATVKLTLSGAPVTGVLFSGITVHYKKFGQSSLTAKTVISGDWLELGGGYYTLSFSASETDTVGNFFFNVAGAGFDTFSDSFSVEFIPPEIANLPPTVCLVSGFIYDVGGTPIKNSHVRVKPVAFPMGDFVGNIISSLPATAVTDHKGFFQIELIRGKTVIIEVEATGIRNQQITVPDAPTAQLADLMPPFPN